MSIGYRLGTYAAGIGGLAYLEDLGLSVLPYPTPFNPWADIYDVGNGQTYGDGYAFCEWRFRYLTPADMIILLGYIGSGNQSTQVCLSTKNDSDVWDDYSAYMHRPTYPNQGDRRPGGWWTGVVFRFSFLETL